LSITPVASAIRRSARRRSAPAGRQQGALGPDGLIEPVENRRRVNQHLAVVEHE
jgi:hypothetical protein